MVLESWALERGQGRGRGRGWSPASSLASGSCSSGGLRAGAATCLLMGVPLWPGRRRARPIGGASGPAASVLPVRALVPAGDAHFLGQGLTWGGCPHLSFRLRFRVRVSPCALPPRGSVQGLPPPSDASPPPAPCPEGGLHHGAPGVAAAGLPQRRPPRACAAPPGHLPGHVGAAAGLRGQHRRRQRQHGPALLRVPRQLPRRATAARQW